MTCGCPGGVKYRDTWASLMRGRFSGSVPFQKKWMYPLLQSSLSHGDLCSCRAVEARVTAISKRCCRDSFPSFIKCFLGSDLAGKRDSSLTGDAGENGAGVVVIVILRFRVRSGRNPKHVGSSLRVWTAWQRDSICDRFSLSILGFSAAKGNRSQSELDINKLE